MSVACWIQESLLFVTNFDNSQQQPVRQRTAHKDDTQESYVARPHLVGEQEYDEPASGPGCWIWLLLSIFGICFSVLIVTLSATAGWTSGHQESDIDATATQNLFIDEQLRRIPTDIASGYHAIMVTRIAFLATLTPGIPEVPQLRVTATALYLNSLPTYTPVPTATAIVEIVPTQAQSTDYPTQNPTDVSVEVLYDLNQMLEDARFSIRFGDYDEAYETLDAIVRIDDQFERATVRALMSDVLTTQAEQLFRSPNATDLAEAIRLTDLAEQYGSIGELSYERLVAEQYLSIQSAVNAGDHAIAIILLNNMINTYQSEYKGVDFRWMLFNEYVSYGDAWGSGSDYCQAVIQYNRALGLFTDTAVVDKRNQAQTECDRAALATPSPGGISTAPPSGPPGS
jgi:hypothetical protein